MKKKTMISALAAATAAASLLYFTYAHPLDKASATPAPAPAVPIVAGVVTQHEVPIYLSGVGTVIAYNTDVVRAQIQGQIMSINFTEGQTVHAGDLLAQIDPRPYQALIDQFPASRFVPDAYVQMGEHYFQHDDLARARAAFEKAVAFRLPKVYAFALYKLAWCDYNAHDYRGAIAKFEEVIDYSERQPQAKGDRIHWLLQVVMGLKPEF